MIETYVPAGDDWGRDVGAMSVAGADRAERLFFRDGVRLDLAAFAVRSTCAPNERN